MSQPFNVDEYMKILRRAGLLSDGPSTTEFLNDLKNQAIQQQLMSLSYLTASLGLPLTTQVLEQTRNDPYVLQELGPYVKSRVVGVEPIEFDDADADPVDADLPACYATALQQPPWTAIRLSRLYKVDETLGGGKSGALIFKVSRLVQGTPREAKGRQMVLKMYVGAQPQAHLSEDRGFREIVTACALSNVPGFPTVRRFGWAQLEEDSPFFSDYKAQLKLNYSGDLPAAAVAQRLDRLEDAVGAENENDLPLPWSALARTLGSGSSLPSPATFSQPGRRPLRPVRQFRFLVSDIAPGLPLGSAKVDLLGYTPLQLQAIPFRLAQMLVDARNTDPDFVHNDMHPDNIFVSDTPGSEEAKYKGVTFPAYPLVSSALRQIVWLPYPEVNLIDLDISLSRTFSRELVGSRKYALRHFAVPEALLQWMSRYLGLTNALWVIDRTASIYNTDVRFLYMYWLVFHTIMMVKPLRQLTLANATAALKRASDELWKFPVCESAEACATHTAFVPPNITRAVPTVLSETRKDQIERLYVSMLQAPPAEQIAAVCETKTDRPEPELPHRLPRIFREGEEEPTEIESQVKTVQAEAFTDRLLWALSEWGVLLLRQILPLSKMAEIWARLVWQLECADQSHLLTFRDMRFGVVLAFQKDVFAASGAIEAISEAIAGSLPASLAKGVLAAAQQLLAVRINSLRVLVWQGKNGAQITLDQFVWKAEGALSALSAVHYIPSESRVRLQWTGGSRLRGFTQWLAGVVSNWKAAFGDVKEDSEHNFTDLYLKRAPFSVSNLLGMISQIGPILSKLVREYRLFRAVDLVVLRTQAGEVQQLKKRLPRELLSQNYYATLDWQVAQLMLDLKRRLRVSPEATAAPTTSAVPTRPPSRVERLPATDAAVLSRNLLSNASVQEALSNETKRDLLQQTVLYARAQVLPQMRSILSTQLKALQATYTQLIVNPNSTAAQRSQYDNDLRAFAGAHWQYRIGTHLLKLLDRESADPEANLVELLRDFLWTVVLQRALPTEVPLAAVLDEAVKRGV